MRLRFKTVLSAFGVGLGWSAAAGVAFLGGLVLFALKFGTGREIRIDCRQLKAQVSIDVVYEGPDPAAFIPRQAFVDLSPMLVSPPRVLQEIGLAFIAALSVTLGVAFSHGTARSGRRRLTLRLARAA